LYWFLFNFTYHSPLRDLVVGDLSVSFRAASFASWSASSFPYVPRWALSHENSIVQLAVSRMDTFFLISSMRKLWLVLFFRESIVILLSVKMATVRGPFSVVSNVSIASSALTMASCSAWLLEHFLFSWNFSCAASSFSPRIPKPTYVCMYVMSWRRWYASVRT
jgi:hypothetical protein